MKQHWQPTDYNQLEPAVVTSYPFKWGHKGEDEYGYDRLVFGQVNPSTNRLHGLGIRIDLDNGQFSEGYWDEEGRHQGYGQDFYYDWCYVGEYKDGDRHGQGKHIYYDGTTKEGLFAYDDLVEGTRVNEDGSTEQGKFENEVLIQGTHTDKDGNITQVAY